MTEQVRTTYRSHRTATWALVLGAVALIAVIVIPLATAADKVYTLTATSPVCTGPAPKSAFTLNNTSTSQTLGSAEIYFPKNTVASSTIGTVATNTSTTNSPPGKWDILQLNNLGILRQSSRQFTVTFNANVTFSQAIKSTVKQSNQFNDTQGGANLFTNQGSDPTLSIVNCVTIKGRVYQDRNLDNAYTTGAGAFLNSDVPKAWKVDLYQKSTTAAAYPSDPFKTVDPSSSTDGSYTFLVPPGSDYKICVTAAGGDASSKWALQIPAKNTDCGPISDGGPTSSSSVPLANLNADVIGPDPGTKCQPDPPTPCPDFQVVPVVGLDAQGVSTVGGYTVDASSNSDPAKLAQFYVHDTWVDENGNRNFRFSPITPSPNTTPCEATPLQPRACIYLLETLTADVPLSILGGKQLTLRYDDVAPFLDVDLKPMPYCLIDPRQSGGALATSGVLGNNSDGSRATSCIVEASQNSLAGGVNVHTVYKVYTSYDGGRQVGVG